MSITWVHSEEGGYWPCANSQEMDQFKKAGFKPCGDPAVHSGKKAKTVTSDHEVPMPQFVNHKDLNDQKDLNELSREELLAIAETRNVIVDNRWGTTKLKEVLGL